VSDTIDLSSEDFSKSTDRRPLVMGSESGHCSERQFDNIAERLIYVATADNMLPSDALAALTKALGTLIAFTARREGLTVEEVLKPCQNVAADYAMAAAIYMRENADIDRASSLMKTETGK
jgi:hypothetical protein